MNDIVPTSVASNSGLACDGKAPAIFRRCTKNGLPVYCLILTALVGLLAYMNVSTGSTTAFGYLSNLSSITGESPSKRLRRSRGRRADSPLMRTGLLTWACINFSFIRFYYGCKRQGIDRNEFPFKAPFVRGSPSPDRFLLDSANTNHCP